MQIKNEIPQTSEKIIDYQSNFKSTYRRFKNNRQIFTQR